MSGCRKWGDCTTCPFTDCKDESKGTYNKDYYEKHKEEYLEYQKQYRREHPTMQYEANKRWVETHRDHKNELQRAYRRRKKLERLYSS